MKSTLIDDYYKYFGNEVIFLDLETTGISCEDDHIIEIGGIKYRNNKEVARFETFVNTSKLLSSRIINLTGIQDKDLVSAPKLSTILEEFRTFIGDSPIFAHNSEFEKKFLLKIFDGNIINKFYDTCYFSCLTFPSLKSYSLENLMIEFGIKDYEMHRALEDALDAKTVMNYLIEEGLTSIPIEVIEKYTTAFNKDDYMVRDMLLAIKNVYDKNGSIIHQPFLNFSSKKEELNESNIEFQEKFQDVIGLNGNAIIQFPNNFSHKANITHELSKKSHKPKTILFVSDYDRLENWKKYFDKNSEGKKIKFIDKLSNYLCDSHIDRHIEKAYEEKNITGFDIYMKILLSKKKVIQKNKIAPFLLFRESGKSPLLSTYAEVRKDCSNRECISKNCIMKELKTHFSDSDIVVTFVSNLYILDKYNSLDILDQKLIIFDNLEYLEKFYDENLESFTFKTLETLLGNLKEKIDNSNKIFNQKLLPSLKNSGKYLKTIDAFLKNELKDEQYRIAISKQKYNYEEIICEFLDLFISLTNLYKVLLNCNENSKQEFWYIDYSMKISVILNILKEIFEKSESSIKYLQLLDNGENIKVSLQYVNLGDSFRKLVEDGKKQIVITTGAGDNYKFREFMLNLTSLSNLGEFESINLAAHAYRGIDLLIPENIPDLTSRSKNYLKKFKEFIVKIVKSRKGKTVIIMNSMARMKNLAVELEKELEKEDILFLQQHFDGGKNKLLKVSSNVENCLIIGSQAFYTHLDSDEGEVDTIIVEKPPFPFFKDEFIIARRNMFQDRGFDDFDDFIVPQTILKLRNGLRRLSNDGLFVIADSKISNNNYFNFIMDAISPADIYKSLESYTTFKLL